MYIFKYCGGGISSQVCVRKMCHLMVFQLIRNSSTTEWQQLQMSVSTQAAIFFYLFFLLLLLSNPESRVLPVKYL